MLMGSPNRNSLNSSRPHVSSKIWLEHKVEWQLSTFWKQTKEDSYERNESHNACNQVLFDRPIKDNQLSCELATDRQHSSPKIAIDRRSLWTIIVICRRSEAISSRSKWLTFSLWLRRSIGLPLGSEPVFQPICIRQIARGCLISGKWIMKNSVVLEWDIIRLSKIGILM